MKTQYCTKAVFKKLGAILKALLGMTIIQREAAKGWLNTRIIL